MCSLNLLLPPRYIKNRNKELDRLKEMEEEAKKETLDAEFERKRLERQRAEDEKTAKRAEKRRREKEKQRAKAQGGKGSDDGPLLPKMPAQQGAAKQPEEGEPPLKKKGFGRNEDAVKAVVKDIEEKDKLPIAEGNDAASS